MIVDNTKSVAGPFGCNIDRLGRAVGAWSDEQMVYAAEVLGGRGQDDPQVLLTGSEADWMPRAKRWKFRGKPVRAVIRLSEYRDALARDASK